MLAISHRVSQSIRGVATASALLLGVPALASHGNTALFAGKLEVAAECGCSGKADCTCKKGTCKCTKCGKSNRVRVYDALKSNPDPAKLPETARFDATAGVFI